MTQQAFPVSVVTVENKPANRSNLLSIYLEKEDLLKAISAVYQLRNFYLE
ncbi:hypothetical protein ACFSQD_18570 [Flavihumibacter stibioxidans]|nr:hypothetical protein [Flavihumibacter stibioxidans]